MEIRRNVFVEKNEERLEDFLNPDTERRRRFRALNVMSLLEPRQISHSQTPLSEAQSPTVGILADMCIFKSH